MQVKQAKQVKHRSHMRVAAARGEGLLYALTCGHSICPLSTSQGVCVLERETERERGGERRIYIYIYTEREREREKERKRDLLYRV